MQKKNSRDSNWGYAEKSFLVEEVRKYSAIIENKKVDNGSNNKKNEAWERIQCAFNANGYVRDTKKLKEQWKRMKIAAKSSIAHEKKYKHGTGGGPPKKQADALDYAIEEIIPMDFIQDSSQFDSDRNKSTLSEMVQIQNESNLPEPSLIPVQNYSSNTTVPEESTSIVKDPQPAPSSSTVQLSTGTAIRRKKRETTGRKMSFYEERCLDLYKKKICLQMKHQRKMHNIRKRWEEKIYKLKYDLLKNSHSDDLE